MINFTFHSYADLFETTRRDIYCQYPIPGRRSWLDVVPGLAGVLRTTRVCYRMVRAASKLNESLPILGKTAMTVREPASPNVISLEGPEFQDHIRDARIVFAYGWRFRAPGCIERHAAKIRAYFRPVERYELASRQAVDRLRQQADVVIGVHVRHGDFVQWRGGKFFFPTSRYAAWMRELAEQFPGSKVAFLVCSDEPRNEEEFPGLRVGFGAGPAIVDLYALAKCDYILGPVSTFSQWAAFYGDKPLFHLRDSQAPVDRAKFRSAGYNLGETPEAADCQITQHAAAAT